MKHPIYIYIICFLSSLLIHIQVLEAQVFNEQVELNYQTEILSYKPGHHKAINPKYNAHNFWGSSSGGSFIGRRSIDEKWSLDFEAGYLKTNFIMHLDRDFGDLDEIIGFSEPTVEGDYENIDEIKFDNTQFKWGISFNTKLNKKSETGFQTYFGFGLENRILMSSHREVSFRDSVSYFLIFQLSDNNFATPSQREEAINFYQDKLVKNSWFFILKFGMDIPIEKRIIFSLEPKIVMGIRPYMPDLMKNSIGLGINVGLKVLI